MIVLCTSLRQEAGWNSFAALVISYDVDKLCAIWGFFEQKKKSPSVVIHRQDGSIQLSSPFPRLIFCHTPFLPTSEAQLPLFSPQVRLSLSQSFWQGDGCQTCLMVFICRSLLLSAALCFLGFPASNNLPISCSALMPSVFRLSQVLLARNITFKVLVVIWYVLRSGKYVGFFFPIKPLFLESHDSTSTTFLV